MLKFILLNGNGIRQPWYRWLMLLCASPHRDAAGAITCHARLSSVTCPATLAPAGRPSAAPGGAAGRGRGGGGGGARQPAVRGGAGPHPHSGRPPGRPSRRDPGEGGKHRPPGPPAMTSTIQYGVARHGRVTNHSLGRGPARYLHLKTEYVAVFDVALRYRLADHLVTRSRCIQRCAQDQYGMLPVVCGRIF